MSFANTDYGFQYGPAEVRRDHIHPKHGAWLTVKGAKEEVTIRITKAGHVRVFNTRKRLPQPMKGEG